MPTAFLPDLRLHYLDEGNRNGPPLVLCHALGFDLTIWDQVVALLPPTLRIIRYDQRGHGKSDCPTPPYTMGALIRDAERLLDHLALKDTVFLGLSMGGLVAQGLAVKRLDLVRALILSNTAVKIGTPTLWAERIAQVKSRGMAAIAADMTQRQFSRRFRNSRDLAPWMERLLASNPEGYVGCAEAISGSDFYTPTAALTLPSLILGSGEDGATPADLVRETRDLILGSEFQLIKGAGHLPCIEKPQEYALAVTGFLRRIGHLQHL